MLNLKITPNVNNNSDFYIFFCEKNFSFNSKKLSFLDINNKEIYLGSFFNEYDAHLAYQKELNLIINTK